MESNDQFRCLLCGTGRREIELRRDPRTDAYLCRQECWDRWTASRHSAEDPGPIEVIERRESDGRIR